MLDDDDKTDDNIQDRHKGNDFFGDRGDALDAADKDQARDNGQQDADDYGLHAERPGKGVADGVGLDHVAHAAQGEDDGDGKKGRQGF